LKRHRANAPVRAAIKVHEETVLGLIHRTVSRPSVRRKLLEAPPATQVVATSRNGSNSGHANALGWDDLPPASIEQLQEAIEGAPAYIEDFILRLSEDTIP
jgi:hypothetical protein